MPLDALPELRSTEHPKATNLFVVAATKEHVRRREAEFRDLGK